MELDVTGVLILLLAVKLTVDFIQAVLEGQYWLSRSCLWSFYSPTTAAFWGSEGRLLDLRIRPTPQGGAAEGAIGCRLRRLGSEPNKYQRV